MITLIMDEKGDIARSHAHWDGSPLIGFGPLRDRCHHAYLTTEERKQDLKSSGKDPNESDTTQGSDTDDSDVEEPKDHAGVKPSYKQGMSRQEVKALDSEIPWRRIAEMDEHYVEKFLAAIQKEADSWSAWQSVEPLSSAEAEKVFRDPQLKHRVLKSRACYTSPLELGRCVPSAA